jgi:PAS domain S-box-containing protein
VSDSGKTVNEELEIAREQIEQAHQEWIAALDAIDTPIFLHDKDFRILRCNRAYQRCAGMPFKQIIGQPYYDIFPKTHAPLPHCLMVMGKTEVETGEVAVGDAIYNSRASSINDAEGSYLYSVHVLEDITGRKRDEKTLRESEAFIKTVLDNLPVGIAVNSLEPSVEFSYMNDNFPGIYRTTREKLAAPGAFWESVYEDPEFRQQIRTRVLEDCASGDVERMKWADVPITRNGEEPVFVSARDIPLPDKNLVISMVWDVTDRKHAEEVLREEKVFSDALVQKLPDIFFLLDARGRLLRWNANLMELSGLSPEQLAASNALDFIDEADRPLIERKVQRALETGSASAEARLVLKSGARDYALTGARIETSRGPNIIGLGADITERKQAEQKLRESERRYRTLFEAMLNGFAYCRMLYEDGKPSDFIYLDVNAAFEKQTGLKDVVGKRVSEVIPGIREADPHLFEVYGRVAAGGEPEQFETYVAALQMWFFISVYSPQPEHFVAVFDAITERKRAEEALKNEAQRHRLLMESSRDGIAIINQQHQIVEANPSFAEMLGYAPEELLGLHTWEIDATMTEADIRSNFPDFSTTSATFETRHRRKDGTTYDVEVSLGGAMVSSEPMIFAVSRDITARKLAEEALRGSAATLQEAQRLAGIGNWEWNLQTGLMSWSEEIYLIYGRDPELPPAGYEEVRRYFTPQSWERLSAAVEEAMNKATAYECDAEVVRPDGTHRWVTARGEGISDAGGKVVQLHGTVQDITERKQHEIAMQRANRALRTISAGNQALIHATEEQGLLREMCEVAVQAGGYRMAWIGYARDDAARTIEQMAQAGFERGCSNLAPLTWDETRQGTCPAGDAIVQGRIRVVQDIQSDSDANLWRENAREYGYASCIALPLLEGERAFGVLVLFDDRVNVFNEDEVQLLEEMSGDLAFGILTLRIKEAHREHEQRLHKNMLQTVEAIAGIVEMRDPYTSGHQARVAELAREIARRMGLSEEQAQVIHLAGLVHDLGKIRIPSEILSKPSRLSEIEYSLIKVHPQAGYDILKGIDFSWPIAEMVLQHHERLDGSGYPQGLKGEGILQGARILSVADVVEAMSSHRPYRPGMGVEASLEEISRGRGTLYDPQAVDACVALFKEQGFVFPS